MPELFNRQWALTIGDRQWTDLRVVFEINRNLSKRPDPAQITIYNLAQQTRSGFAGGEQVRLVAGYGGAAGLIYSGTLTQITPQRDGPDYAISLTCRDGDAAVRATIRQSYVSGAPLSIVVGNLVSAMGLTLGAGAAQQLAGKSTRGPVAHVGYANDKLEEALVPFGLRYTLNDGTVQIIEDDGATSEEAVLLSPNTGLVGFPEPIVDSQRPTKKKKKKHAKRLRLTSLLQSGLMPGRRVALQGVPYAGVYRVDRLIHKGDSHGQDWYSVAECTVVEGSIGIL
jgi:hypothetical protein